MSMGETDTGFDAGPDDAVAHAQSSRTSLVVRSDDPERDALRLVDALGADLADDVDALAGELERRSAPADDVLITIENLRHLHGRIRDARRLVSEGEDAVRSRVSQSTGLAVHPETIRKAADEVFAAREALEATTAELEGVARRLEPPDAPPEPEDGPDVVEVDGPDAFGDDDPELDAAMANFAAAEGAEDDLGIPEDIDEEPSVRWALVVLTLALIGGIAVFLAGGGPLGVIVPIIAMGWVYIVIRRSRIADEENEAAEGNELVMENLASITALTSKAYGGGGAAALDTAVESQDLVLARNRVTHATRVLRNAEARWVSLVGDRSVEDVEAVMAERDPQAAAVPTEVVAESPTVRAAGRHLRRLEAQWRVAWWASDRDVPEFEQAEAALDALGADGRTIVRASGADPEVTSPLVVLDDAGSIDEAWLADRSETVDGRARVVVVAPRP